MLKETRNLSTNVLTGTDTYAYNCSQWRDQLTAYDGAVISYDNAGNPLLYRGATLTWQNGRQLATHARGGITTTFKYDHSGKRTHKNGTRYFWQGSKLLAERRAGDSSPIYYYYDESGICGMRHNNQDFYFQKNVLGDVLAVYNTLGQLQARYTYDAWGNHRIHNFANTLIYDSQTGAITSGYQNNVGVLNSFRYRSYYWDNEFLLYYLKTRYYDPTVGRFISADEPSLLFETSDMVGGINLYAYCLNNPVMLFDPTGQLAISTFLIGLAIAAVTFAVINTAVQVVSDVVNWIITGTWDGSWENYVGAFVGGLVGGAVFFATKGTGFSKAFGAMGFAQSLTTNLLTNATGRNELSFGEIALNAVIAGGLGLAFGKLGKKKPGISAGRNSFLAVWKSGLTKLKNRTAKKMSLNVIKKGSIAVAHKRRWSGVASGVISSIREFIDGLIN